MAFLWHHCKDLHQALITLLRDVTWTKNQNWPCTSGSGKNGRLYWQQKWAWPNGFRAPPKCIQSLWVWEVKFVIDKWNSLPMSSTPKNTKKSFGPKPVVKQEVHYFACNASCGIHQPELLCKLLRFPTDPPKPKTDIFFNVDPIFQSVFI